VVAPLGVIVALGLFIPVTALGARRLREAGFSPWWLLLQLIPILGFVVALIMLAQPAKVNAVELGSTAPVNVDNFGF
jgi:uncharacterized membrane protein YhaH (DUF805 family)